jgi:hypothetical protein
MVSSIFLIKFLLLHGSMNGTKFMILLVPFFFIQLLAFMDSQKRLEEFNETPTQSFTMLLQGGASI